MCVDLATDVLLKEKKEMHPPHRLRFKLSSCFSNSPLQRFKEQADRTKVMFQALLACSQQYFLPAQPAAHVPRCS